MSLLITSSSQGVNETNQVGIAQPQQYKNHLKNSLMIPPGSEIAVQSVKIQRDPAIDAGAQMVGNFWFGERLARSGSLAESVGYIIPTTNRIGRSLGVGDFADQYVKTLKDAYSFHPEINSNAITMSVSKTAQGAFVGFDYVIPQNGTYAADLIPPEDTVVSTLGQRARDAIEQGFDDSIEWDGDMLTSNSESKEAVYGQLLPRGAEGGPISLHNGSLTYDCSTIPGNKFTVGLARPMVLETDNFYQYPEDVFGADAAQGIGEQGGDFYDYAAQVDTDGFLRLYHSVPAIMGSSEAERIGADNDQNAEDGWKGIIAMKEIAYYQKAAGSFVADNSANSDFATGTPIVWGAADNGKITFKVMGETVSVLLGDKGAATFKMICTAKSVNYKTKNQVPKPVAQTAWKMYPTFTLWDDEDEIEITEYHCRTEATLWNNQPENSWITRTTTDVHLGNGSAVDHDALRVGDITPLPMWNNAFGWGQDVDTRDMFQPYVALTATPTVPIQGGLVRAPLGYTSFLLDTYENIFITGSSEIYMDKAIQQWQPNTAQQLGFEGYAASPLAGMGGGGAGAGANFVSAQRPSLMSKHSTFIRVPTFTHQTFNCVTGNPSKILYQVPRFDNAGTETGALYFQNPDKTYIDLNNTDELRITDIDVQFVRKDETFVSDLTGSSEVVFHIRKKA